MNRKEQQLLRQRQTTRQLMGVTHLTEHGAVCGRDELLFYLLRPDNLSILSPEGIHVRPQQDAASGVSSGDSGGQAAAQLLPMVSHLRQPPLDIGHRLRQNRPGLRVPVQAATIRRQLRLHGLRLPA